MIFIFILIFGVLFLFWNIRAIAPGNKGSLTAGAIVILLPICFFFREHFWACIGQAFLSVWLCEALLIYLGWWAVRFIRQAFRPKRPLPPSSAKRAARILLVASVAISAGMCIYGVHHNDDYVIHNSEFTIQNSQLKSDMDFTVLFFSDLHLDPLFNGEKLQRMVQDAKRLHPDLILFGGDLADMHTDALNDLGYDSLFRQLSAAATIAAIAVNGNHEGYMERSGSDPHGWLRQNGFIVLDDSTACTKVACITGRTDTQVARARGTERKSLAQLLPKNKTLTPDSAQSPSEIDTTSLATTSPEIKRLPWLLLDHQPKGIEPEYSGRLPDLALSGHTHDGQFFPGTIIINWVWRLAYGFGEIDGVKWLVTSGIGSWGPPVRVGSDTEMWFIEFRTN